MDSFVDPSGLLAHVASTDLPADISRMSPEEPILQGFLKEEAEGEPGSPSDWKRRWFVLRRGRLEMYRRPPADATPGASPAAPPSEATPLSTLTGIAAELPDCPMPNAFQLATHTRIITLCAPLEAARRHWLTAITAALVALKLDSAAASVALLARSIVHGGGSGSGAGATRPPAGGAPPRSTAALPRGAPPSARPPSQKKAPTHPAPAPAVPLRAAHAGGGSGGAPLSPPAGALAALAVSSLESWSQGAAASPPPPLLSRTAALPPPPPPLRPPLAAPLPYRVRPAPPAQKVAASGRAPRGAAGAVSAGGEKRAPKTVPAVPLLPPPPLPGGSGRVTVGGVSLPLTPPPAGATPPRLSPLSARLQPPAFPSSLAAPPPPLQQQPLPPTRAHRCRLDVARAWVAALRAPLLGGASGAVAALPPRGAPLAPAFANGLLLASILLQAAGGTGRAEAGLTEGLSLKPRARAQCIANLEKGLSVR
jgi:hypothetical protein